MASTFEPAAADDPRRRFSDSLSPAMDQASSHTRATMVPKPMISTIRHLHSQLRDRSCQKQQEHPPPLNAAFYLSDLLAQPMRSYLGRPCRSRNCAVPNVTHQRGESVRSG